MTALDRAIDAITQTLESLHIDYAVVGGIANAVWGEPRATIDDRRRSLGRERRPAQTVDAVSKRFQTPVDDAAGFVQRTRVLPLDTDEGVRIGVMFALLPFELDAIRRAQRVPLADPGRQQNRPFM
jgi:hypothetical protein